MHMCVDYRKVNAVMVPDSHPLPRMEDVIDDVGKASYATIEKEALALLMSLEHFKVYVGQSPVTVYTDHNPLVFLERMKLNNQRLLRWSLTLQPYNLDIRHIKGTDNLIADAFSRA
ncbi:hypothetical protein Pmani_014397 [Petrolisthes manimaculis]|uniref:Reverse transcriptase RNase H-like domain-containing protein n=1 Tax=Petrolisthes manimaculis TaxID=1843537 RepID=A0AAE1PU99_9EUCA|nr:hypothetical protein Pmani_014397 [Petrolisthes manimaculis]